MRKTRNWIPGASYHVMSRGIRRSTLFRDEQDYLTFLEYVARAKETMPFTIHACCLMTNHFHICMGTEDVELSKIMRKILHPFSMYFNKKYKLTGHVFESRFTSCGIGSEPYFLEVSRYIHLNPVKAGIVDTPLNYVYSSYEEYIFGNDKFSRDPVRRLMGALTDTTKTLSMFGGNPREEYRIFVEEKLSHEEQENQIMKDIGEI